MLTKAEPGPTSAERRRCVIETQLTQLECFLGDRSSGSRQAGSVEAPFPDTDVSVDPWVLDRIATCGDDPSTDTLAELLAQTAATMAKCAGDIRRFRTNETALGSDLYAVQAELMVDTAIGMALLREAQPAIEDSVRRGAITEAKKLTLFRHGLRKAITEVESCLGDSEKQRIAGLADSMTQQPREEETSSSLDLDRLAGDVLAAHELVKKRRRSKALLAIRMPALTDSLFVILLALCGIWLLISLGPHLRGQEFAMPRRSEFVAVDAVLAIKFRPPSLFVEVDEKVWNGYAEDHKRNIVDGMANVLLAHDYRGAFFYTTNGKPVAQWLRKRASRLLEPPAGAMEPESPLPGGVSKFRWGNRIAR